MKMIMKAGEIPDGTIVTKITGSYKYIVQREINIYGENPQTIKTEGTVFLIPQSNSSKLSINCYPNDKEFMVHMTDEQFRNFAQDIIDNHYD